MGILMIYVQTSVWNNQLDKIMEKPDFEKYDVSWSEFFIIHQFILIISLLFIIAGFLLFRYKKAGWYTSIAAWLTFGITSLVILKPSSTWTMSKSGYWAFGIVSVVTIAVVIILLTKSVREKYSVNKKSWVYLCLILLFFLLNKQLFG